MSHHIEMLEARRMLSAAMPFSADPSNLTSLPVLNLPGPRIIEFVDPNIQPPTQEEIQTRLRDKITWMETEDRAGWVLKDQWVIEYAAPGPLNGETGDALRETQIRAGETAAAMALPGVGGKVTLTDNGMLRLSITSSQPYTPQELVEAFKIWAEDGVVTISPAWVPQDMLDAAGLAEGDTTGTTSDTATDLSLTSADKLVESAIGDFASGDVNEWGWPIYTVDDLTEMGLEWIEWNGNGGWGHTDTWTISFRETNPYDMMDERRWTWEPADWQARVLEIGFDFDVQHVWVYNQPGVTPGHASSHIHVAVPADFNPYELISALKDAGYGDSFSGIAPDWSLWIPEVVLPGKPADWVTQWTDPVNALPDALTTTSSSPTAAPAPLFSTQPVATNDLLTDDDGSLLGVNRPILT